MDNKLNNHRQGKIFDLAFFMPQLGESLPSQSSQPMSILPTGVFNLVKEVLI